MHRSNHIYSTHYLALISFLLINLIWQLIVVFILPCILIPTVKLFIANSILSITEYSRPYESSAWDYKRSDENAIAKALHKVDWNFFFFF